VTDINYIKQEVNIKGRSYSDVAKQMGRDPRTIKKYADKEDWNETSHKQNRKGKVMDLILRQENRHRFFYRAFAWWPS